MDHKELDAWKKAIEIVSELYKVTDSFPEVEKFGLISQIRRAVVSIPTNIAEGAARKSNKEFIQFLYISLGSLSELETLLIISEKLGFLDSYGKLEKDLINVKKLILGLIKYLKKKIGEK